MNDKKKELGGHTDFGKDLVITTRDVSNAYMNSGGVRDPSDKYFRSGCARALLKEAGSAPWRLLSYKAEIDAAVAQLVRGA